MTIDFHTHTFPLKIAAKTLHLLGEAADFKPFTEGTEEALLSSMDKYGIDYSVTLPVMTNPGQVEKLNSITISNVEDSFSKGLISFGGMHPDFPDYKGELKRLKENGIKGIKLHPAYQGTDVDDIRIMRIIAESSALDMIVLIHAGEDSGIPGHNYASVSQILNVIDTVRPEKFVLGHMGGWNCWKEVEYYLAGAHVWLDTAHALIPKDHHPNWANLTQFRFNLSDNDFIRLSRKHGTDRILFATDSPWQEQGEFVHTINEMNLTQKEKDNILFKNAFHLLNL